MATLSPLARVKEEFGGKDKLVDKIVGLLGTGDDEPKDELRRRLLGAANKKLIRLHGIASDVKAAGGKEAAAAAAAAELGRAKDKDYVAKLASYSSGRILDVLKSAKRRKVLAAATKDPAKAAARKAKPASPAPAKAAVKATAKKPAAKKSSAK